MDIDRKAAGAFARQLVSHLSSAMTVTALELARRTGLLQAALQPCTVDTLSEVAGLDRRYVTELVELLVTAGVLVHDVDADTVVLPPEHAAALVHSTPYNLSGMVTVATNAAASLDQLETVVRHGGGIAHDDQRGDADEVLHRMSAARYDALLVDSYLAQVPGLTDRLQQGASVLELGCGQGHAALLVARAFPASTVVGLDISADAIAEADRRARDEGLGNVRFVVGSASAPPVEAVDVVLALDVVHDLADPAAALSGARRVLGEDGLLLMIDSGAPATLAERSALPWAPMMYGVSLAYCMTVSLAQGGAGLGNMWGREAALAALAAAGFDPVQTHELKGDPMDLLYVASPASGQP